MPLTRWEINFIWDISVWDGYPEPDVSFEKGVRKVHFKARNRTRNFKRRYRQTHFKKRDSE